MTSRETEATPTEIVVGLNETAASVAALQWAAEYAARTGATMRLVHAFEVEPSEMFGVSAELRHTMVQDARAGLSRMARDTIGVIVSSDSWRLEIVEGPTGPVLVEMAADAELLVLGTGEHTGVRRLLGSVSHYCLSHAMQPIVAVPSRAGQSQHATVAGTNETLVAGPPR